MVGNYLDFQCCFHRAAKKLTRIWISISNFYLILRFNLVIKTAEYRYRLLLSKPLLSRLPQHSGTAIHWKVFLREKISKNNILCCHISQSKQPSVTKFFQKVSAE